MASVDDVKITLRLVSELTEHRMVLQVVPLCFDVSNRLDQLIGVRYLVTQFE